MNNNQDENTIDMQQTEARTDTPQAVQLKNVIHDLRQVLSTQQYESTAKLATLENVVSSINIEQTEDIQITPTFDANSKHRSDVIYLQIDHYRNQIQCKALENEEIQNNYNALQCQYHTLKHQHDVHCKINDMRLNRLDTMYKNRIQNLKKLNQSQTQNALQKLTQSHNQIVSDLNKQIEDLKSQLERQNEPHCASLTKEDEPPTSNDRHRLRVIEADVSSLDEDHTVVLDAETEDIIASISEHEMQNLRQSLVDDADTEVENEQTIAAGKEDQKTAMQTRSRSVLDPTQIKQSIDSLVGMGFDKRLVSAAMRRTRNDPDKAYELLSTWRFRRSRELNSDTDSDSEDEENKAEEEEEIEIEHAPNPQRDTIDISCGICGCPLLPSLSPNQYKIMAPP
eukprot:227737_1